MMTEKWSLNQESFDELLTWLSPNREQAGQKYEDIRQGLIRVFICRGCSIPEELADESINRVAKKLKDIKDEYEGDRARYFYGVAKNVFFEYLKTRRTPDPPPLPDPPDQMDREYECLEQCVEQLPPENRVLVIGYYQQEKCPKIVQRRQLAEQFGIALNALRIRAHRIRATLRKCMDNCLDEVGPVN
jgi:RNA polymerase sigma factor (sigma-70 family)